MTKTFRLPIRNRKELEAAKVFGATFETNSANKWEPIDSYLYTLAGAIERGQTATELRAVFKAQP